MSAFPAGMEPTGVSDMDEARRVNDLRLRRIASQTGEILPRIQAIRGSRSKKVSLFLKRSRFFSFVRE